MHTLQPVKSYQLTPREWQASALLEASELVGTPEYDAKAVEARRFGALAAEIERLQSALRTAEFQSIKGFRRPVMSISATEIGKCLPRSVSAQLVGNNPMITMSLTQAHHFATNILIEQAAKTVQPLSKVKAISTLALKLRAAETEDVAACVTALEEAVSMLCAPERVEAIHERS